MAYITKRQTADGVKPIGSNLFGTCSTASNTPQKVVNMPDFDVLVEGVTIHVWFAHENTASSPLLKVGSAPTASIKQNGLSNGEWESGSVVCFTYDGTYWTQNGSARGIESITNAELEAMLV